MRTTLNLDDDVAALLKRVRKARNTCLREIVNEALRRGLNQMTALKMPGKPYCTPSRDAGACLIDNLENVAETLIRGEGETHR